MQSLPAASNSSRGTTVYYLSLGYQNYETGAIVQVNFGELCYVNVF